MTVTSLEAAADLAADEASAVLGDLVLDGVRYATAGLAGAMGGGGDCDPELVRHLLAGRSYAELRAMVLLLADCADTGAVTEACGVSPVLAAGNAKRIAEARYWQAEYRHLRDHGLSPELAADRCGITSRSAGIEAETAYRTGKPRQRGKAAA
jgi:hypothetical protein